MNSVFKAIREKNIHYRLLYFSRVSFKIEGKIKTLKDKKKLQKFITTKSAVQKEYCANLIIRERIVTTTKPNKIVNLIGKVHFKKKNARNEWNTGQK